MTLTPRSAQDYGLPPPVRTHLPILLALALAAGCGQRGDALPAPPLDHFHYPALMAAVGQGVTDPTLVVNSTDIDAAYRSGTLLAAALDPGLSGADQILGGLEIVPNATELRVIQDAPGVMKGFDEPGAADCRNDGTPKLFLGADDRLYRMDLQDGVPVCGADCEHALSPRLSSSAWAMAISCPAGPPPPPPPAVAPPPPVRRAWVGFLKGKNDNGYVGQLTLGGDVGVDGKSHDLDDLVEVNVGKGFPQAFAFDRDWNRLYFVTQEDQEAAFLRWIDPGATGCLPFLDADGLQDETRGGCHVDSGVELSHWLRGAEGVDVRLASDLTACETPVEAGVQCRRAYLAIRVYDADLAAANGHRRPVDDIGGQLWVMEIPQTGARPDPRLLSTFDVGHGVARLQVIPRAAGRDLVAIVSRQDAQLWIYDDATGRMEFAKGRDGNGIPLLGHNLVGLAAVRQTSDVTRLFVSSDWDHWISAVDVNVSDPAKSCVVHTKGPDACTPDRTNPDHPNDDILRIKGNL
jgi:hypothetical protein